MTRTSNFTVAALALTACAWSSESVAQGLRPRPSAVECSEWSQDLAAGGAKARGAVTYGWLAACPSGASTLGNAIRAARAERDTSYLFGLAAQASQVRDPSVLNAALEVAGDGQASDRARAASVLVLVSQLGGAWSYPAVTGSALLTDPLPTRGVCGAGVSGTPFATENPLPAGYERAVARVIDGIATGTGAPLLRNLARCSRSVLGNGVPLQIDVSRVEVKHVCGNTFRVRNATGEDLTFSYAVEGTDERGSFYIGAQKHRNISTATAGAFRLIYDGGVIATVANEGEACR